MRLKEGLRPAFVIGYLSQRLNHLPPLTPFSRAANMRSVHTDGSTQAQRAPMSSPCPGVAATREDSSSVVMGFLHPSSCPTFAPRPLRRFSALMRALTPRRLPIPQPGAPDFTLSCFRTSCRQPPDVPRRSFSIPFHSTRRALPCFDAAGSGIFAPHGHGFRLELAGSPVHPAESRSSLSCGPSVPLPLLPTLPRGRCSYGRVQV
jgi:hypothetical protein